ncbi:MAG TPA: TRAP transporter small permease subunit [Xanthomonadales bacterium]|nr:TRAP transporter small permease subunit [Xanthomonadales bacterium]
MTGALARIGAVVRAIENGAIALATAVLVLAAGGEIVARLAFEKGWAELDAMLRALVLWIALLGAMVASREDRHLAVDALSRFARGPWARLLRFVTYGVAAAVCALVAWHALALVRDEHASGTIAFANVPSWLVQSIMPFAFAVMALRFAAHAFKRPVAHVLPEAAPHLHEDAAP